MSFKFRVLAFFMVAILSIGPQPTPAYAEPAESTPAYDDALLVKDYINGAIFPIKDAVAKGDAEGQTFFFSSEDTLHAFEATPAQCRENAGKDIRFYTNQIVEQYFAVQTIMFEQTEKDRTPHFKRMASAARYAATIKIKESETYRQPLHQATMEVIAEAANNCIQSLTEQSTDAVPDTFETLTRALIPMLDALHEDKDGAASAFEFVSESVDGEKGRAWLQDDYEPRNPYSGKESKAPCKLVGAFLASCPSMFGEPAEMDLSARHEGRIYYLCCKDCKRGFKADIEKVTRSRVKGWQPAK